MTSSQVPCPSPNESHATCTPDTTWPVSRHPPYSSWEGFASPVLMSPVPFDASSVVHFRSSLSSTHDVFISRLLTVTFTTADFRTEAAYGCLKPVPTNRLRRAYLHLRHSTVPLDTFMAQRTPENSVEGRNLDAGDLWGRVHGERLSRKRCLGHTPL
jgi:hypothetical protein